MTWNFALESRSTLMSWAGWQHPRAPGDRNNGLGLLASGRSADEILVADPYLERADIDQSLAFAAWRLEHRK